MRGGMPQDVHNQSHGARRKVEMGQSKTGRACQDGGPRPALARNYRSSLRVNYRTYHDKGKLKPARHLILTESCGPDMTERDALTSMSMRREAFGWRRRRCPSPTRCLVARAAAHEGHSDHNLPDADFEELRKKGSRLRTPTTVDVGSREEPLISERANRPGDR